MLLEAGKVCPHWSKCPHNTNNSCYGARSDRNNVFTCDLVDLNGNFTESSKRQRKPIDLSAGSKWHSFSI